MPVQARSKQGQLSAVPVGGKEVVAAAEPLAGPHKAAVALLWALVGAEFALGATPVGASLQGAAGPACGAGRLVEVVVPLRVVGQEQRRKRA